MDTKILERNNTPVLSLDRVKSYLRITHNDDDSLLHYLMGIAVEWVENELNKSLLRQKRSVVHDNNCFCLPYGPLIDIISVKYHKKILAEGEYKVTPKGDSLVIEVPFHWKSPNIEVVYWAGFGENPDDIPPALRHAVLGTMEYLYDHKGDINALEDATLPWLKAHRTYRVGF
jgi:uncharacterized phiE125 gp8 family phage protein